MNDGTLFAIGCSVTFLALGGTYVYLRDYLYRDAPVATKKASLAPAGFQGDVAAQQKS